MTGGADSEVCMLGFRLCSPVPLSLVLHKCIWSAEVARTITLYHTHCKPCLSAVSILGTREHLLNFLLFICNSQQIVTTEPELSTSSSCSYVCVLSPIHEVRMDGATPELPFVCVPRLQWSSADVSDEQVRLSFFTWKKMTTHLAAFLPARVRSKRHDIEILTANL
jgi:hypothetical protein